MEIIKKTSNFDKFQLLLWKNWKLEWNQKAQLAGELLLPVVFSLLLVVLRTLVAAEMTDVTIYNQSFPLDNLDLLRSHMERSFPMTNMKSMSFTSRRKFYKHGDLNTLQYHLAYTPNTSPVFESIVQEAAASLGLTYSGYATSSEMMYIITRENFLAGVEFEASKTDQLNYRIRFPSELRTVPMEVLQTWSTNGMFLPMDNVGPRNKEDMDGGVPPGYLREGFLPVQHAIATAFITQSAKNLVEPLPKVFLQRYPYPQYIDDPLLGGLSGMMGMIIVMSYMYPATYTVKYITAEKEKQLKEVMKIMGLPNWLHWTAWFVKAFLMMGFSSLLITFVLMYKWTDHAAVLTYSSFTAVYFFFLVYTVSSITLCFMLATFFTSATIAAAVAAVIWVVMYLPFIFFQLNYDHLSFDTKIIWSLVSNTAMGLGVRTIVAYELNGVGLQWNNIFSQVSIDDTLVLAHIMGMMCITAVFQMTIALYVEQIFPGDFGVPKEWDFPFTKSFWCGDREYVGMATARSNIRLKPSAFEIEPIGQDLGLQVKHLGKTYGDKVVVDDLSLNMYEDEITVLLGHNGAGKTTTISMLTGMIPPSTGTAIINGCDIRTNIEGARMSLGLCPQHNILFDDLTVRDHLVFYSRLKGLKGAELEEEVNKYIRKINLEDKADVLSQYLSGGMMRKLSVCAAFCGGTKVVLCDEPSTGMDPAARRKLWDLLQLEKHGRTVLLTTHFMDEADVLGDRIAIMCAGELKCLGTPFFLKKKYGGGYYLICEKRPTCKSEEVTKLLRKYIPDIQPEEEIGFELTYQLPDEYSTDFQRMFQDLEKNSDKLNLNGFGITISSLEEVFMKVGAEESTEGTGQSFRQSLRQSLAPEHLTTDNQYILKSWNLENNQWRAMFLKKSLYSLRNTGLFLIQNIIPILFLPVTFILGWLRTYSNLKTLPMSVFEYPETMTVLETSSTVVDGSLEADISKSYKRIVESFGPRHKLTVISSNFIDYMLGIGKKMQVRINTKYIAAATVNDGSITAWLNNKPLHSAPLSLNLIHNAMAKAAIGPKASILVSNAPLPYSRETSFELINSGQTVGTEMAMNICFCMCFVSALYVMFLIKEHESRAKLLQFVAGVKVFTFWFSHFVWDMFTYTITAVIIIITLVVFQEDGFSTFDELSRYFFIILLFGFSALPFTYLLEGCFTEPSEGFGKLAFMNILCGNVLFLVVLIMGYDIFDIQEVSEDIKKVCLAYPHFSLLYGLHNLYLNTQIRKACEPIMNRIPSDIRCNLIPHCCSDTPFLAWEEPGALRQVIYLIVTAIVFLALLPIKEYRYFDSIWFRIKTMRTKLPVPPEDGYYDIDVELERQKIRDMSPSKIAENNLVMDRVTKFYGNLLAVNQISVVVKRSECFGLLGVNGAGKTTTFKMLTGDERISFGEAYIKGLSLRKDMNKVYKNIGYCPQFNALIEEFTGREMLRIFCLIRGIPQEKIPQISSDMAKAFGFIKHYDKQVLAYSGGNKRKLSAALAILGPPSLVLLDEPTTGMDPAARRQIWNIICKLRDAGNSIVLTSHSMEECEALCTRLAMMVNGEFKCLGSIQHLKNQFAKGFILKIKLRKSFELSKNVSHTGFEDEKFLLLFMMKADIRHVLEFIEDEFPEAILQDQFQELLTFYIPISSISWSKIFGLMEEHKMLLNIEDYSISQTSLEEIFLQFAKYQREDPRDINAEPETFCNRFVKWVRSKF